MNPFNSPFIIHLGWTLIHFLWEGALIGCACALVLALLRNARPQARYAVACAALGLCVALPLAHMLDAGANGGVYGGVYTQAAAAGEVAPLMLASLVSPLADLPGEAVAAWSMSLLLSQHLSWVVVCWSLGIGFFSLRMALGLLWLRRLHQDLAPSSPTPNHADWQARLSRMAQGFGLTRSIRLRVLDDLDGPLTAGWWRPVVFVPAALMTGLPPELLEALLAHELAHVKRFDYVINLIQSAIEILLFYHPAVWWISKQIRLEREQIADDLAATKLGEPRRLALALQQLDLFQFSNNQFAQAANGGNLMTRIKRLIRPEVRTLNWKVSIPMIGLATVCIALYANAGVPAAVAPVAPVASITPAEMPAAAASVPALPSLPPSANVPPPARPAALPRLPSLASVPAAPLTPTARPPVLVSPPALPSLPVLASAAAPSTPAAAVTATQKASRNDAESDSGDALAYALVQPSTDTMLMYRTNTAERLELEKLKLLSKGDFLWFRQAGKSYVVTDPALVADALATRQPMAKLDSQMSALNTKMELQGKAMEAIGESMSGLEGNNEALEAVVEKHAHHLEAIAIKIEPLKEHIGEMVEELASTKEATQRAGLEKKVAQLRAELAPLNKEMKLTQAALKDEVKKITTATLPMKELGKKMKEASKPMQELARQMAALGKQQRQASRESERTVREIIQKTLVNGAAKPA